MNNIYLIGMPGCGKSTIAKKLSEISNYEFLDLDSYIQITLKLTISTIFEKYGEDYFRKIEADCLKKISVKDNLIIATGGGVILRQENVDVMRENGKVIFIDTPIVNILNNSNLNNRPLLAENVNKIYDLYDERYDKYLRSADYVVENKSDLEDIAEKLIKII